MPEPTHPPYASGALTTPRQLQRWLDINAQNGPLKRTQAYITVPSFSVQHVWNGYSEIVGEYHYSAPNNFSLKLSALADIIPTDTNYTLCVSYVNSDHTVVRYSLIRATDDVLYFDILPYEGQLIKKNFRIEVWNTSDTNPIQLTDIVIYTSVLGVDDYRYGTDNQLTGSGSLCEGQQSTGTVPTEIPTLSAVGWYSGDYGWTEGVWSDHLSGIPLNSNGMGLRQRTLPNLINVITEGTYEGSIDSPISAYIHYRAGSIYAGGIVVEIHDVANATDIVIRRFGSSFGVNINGSVILLASGMVFDDTHEYIIFVSTDVIAGTVFSVYDAKTLLLVNTASNPLGFVIGNGTTVIFGDSSDGDVSNTTRGMIFQVVKEVDPVIVAYLASLLSNGLAMTLPWTWDVCGNTPIPPTPPVPPSEGATIGIG